VHVGAVVPDAIELAEQRRVPVGPALQVDVVEVGVERLGWGVERLGWGGAVVAMVMRSSIHPFVRCCFVYHGLRRHHG